MIRHKHKKGEWLIEDEQTGIWEYASNMTRQKWDGAITHKRRAEARHPQEFVYPENDPKPMHQVRQTELVDIPDNSASPTVGGTGIAAPRGPAFHLFG